MTIQHRLILYAANLVRAGWLTEEDFATFHHRILYAVWVAPREEAPVLLKCVAQDIDTAAIHNLYTNTTVLAGENAPVARV